MRPGSAGIPEKRNPVSAADPKFHHISRSCHGMDIPLFTGAVRISALVFSGAGAVLIIWGGVLAIVRMIRRELGNSPDTRSRIRRELTARIVFGLEFLVASTILTTIIAPTREDLTDLGAVVAVRTILGYFLAKETAEFSLD
jgi:uncharacterized membrane protein